jgi:hypothetical protein
MAKYQNLSRPEPSTGEPGKPRRSERPMAQQPGKAETHVTPPPQQGKAEAHGGPERNS